MHLVSILLLAISCEVFASVLDEKQCSKFDYEYRVLERIIFLENKNAELQKGQIVLGRKNEELKEIVKEQILEMDRMNEERIEANNKLSEEQNNARKKLFDELRADQADQNTAIEALRKSMKSDTEELKETIAQQRLDAEKFDKKLNDAVNDWSKNLTSEKIRAKIAFEASLQYVVRSSKGIILFNKVSMNEGNAYSPSTGIFRAPVRGLYLFAVYVLARSPSRLRIKKNDDIHTRIYTGHYTGEVSTSKTVVINLNKDDEVYVEADGSVNLVSKAHTTFTCSLLQSENEG